MIRFTLAFSIAALLAIASFTLGCKHPNCPDHRPEITVGRSRTIDGDFHDREGNSMLKGLAKPILSSKKGEDIYGPGHNGEVFKSKDGKDWIFFHAHERSFKPNERPTFLQELKWDREFWPYFDGGKAKYVERRFEVAK